MSFPNDPLINKIKLKFGSQAEGTQLEFNPGSLTIFVGPNNSGKSLILREISSYFSETPKKIVSSIEIDESIVTCSDEQLKTIFHPSMFRSYSDPDILESFCYSNDGSWFKNSITELHTKNCALNSREFLAFLLAQTAIHLDGIHRLKLIEPAPINDLKVTPSNHLMALFQDDSKEEKVREILQRVFDYYFVLDITSMSKVHIRFSKRSPVDSIEEKSLNQTTVNFHRAAVDIKEFGDGVKAFTGLITALASRIHKVILIDEPEAFLHPPLAKKLGQHIARLSKESGANVFISTHSANFLMGAIESKVPINVIRLTYQTEKPTAHLLSCEKLSQLMSEPLLRSTNVLNSLFCNSAIITEADKDRCFYQEIYYRLIQDGEKEKGVLFLNAQNKQTIRKIMAPLCELGIPTAAIVDIDILKEGGAPWTELLRAAKIPELTIRSLSNIRADLHKELKDTAGNDYKKQGISRLDTDKKRALEDFFRQLAEYRIFVVPGGELESWLQQLGVGYHYEGWLAKIFEKMGNDPKSLTYLHPTDDDVFKFVRDILKRL